MLSPLPISTAFFLECLALLGCMFVVRILQIACKRAHTPYAVMTLGQRFSLCTAFLGFFLVYFPEAGRIGVDSVEQAVE